MERHLRVEFRIPANLVAELNKTLPRSRYIRALKISILEYP